VLSAEELKEALDRLATRFEADIQPGTAECGAQGWGQFLDNPKTHLQVGPYGTAAGLIVLALAERGQSVPVTDAQRLLACWWALRDDPTKQEHRLYVQTLRLALQHMAWRFSAPDPPPPAMTEIREALLDRVLPSEMWGNSWANAKVQDHTPRIFPTSMVVLSFALMADGKTKLDERIRAAADQLESKFSVSSGSSLLERAAIAAALIAVRGQKLSGKILRKIDRLARSLQRDLNRQETYYFDFEYLPDSQNRRFSRDYFIVSPQILLAIAGFQSGAPSSLRLMAEQTVETLANNLKQNGHVYKPNESSRVSTIDQAWTAMLFSAAASKHKPPTRLSKMAYGLFRRRKETWWSGTFLPAFATLFVVGFNVVLRDAGLTSRIVSALALSVVSSLYGAKYFRRFLPGGEDSQQ
jgi:hypothetical protein